MAKRKPLHTLCALFGLAMACQPGTAETEQGLDDVVLSADTPVAAFEVTVCVESGTPNGLTLYGTFNAATSTDGEAVEVTLETLDPSEDASPGAAVDLTDASSTAEPTRIFLNTDRDWETSEPRRCQEQVVQISVPSLPDDQTVTVSDITIELRAEWAGLCGAPDADSLSIEAVRI